MHFYSPFSIICRLCHINEYVLIHFTILCFGQTALGTPQISLGAPSLGIFLWDTRPEWELHSLLFAVL